MSAAVDYRDRVKALREKFYPSSKPAYWEPPPKEVECVQRKKIGVRYLAVLSPKEIGPFLPTPLEREIFCGKRDIWNLASCSVYSFRGVRDWRQIVIDVCNARGLSVRDVVGGRRWPPLVAARHECWHLISEETGESLSEIGRKFGKDHTSVMHGIRMHKKRAGIP